MKTQLKIKYPFDPSVKSHLTIALGLAIWIFIFLYFTEPMDTNEFSEKEKLIYLPAYSILGALLYSISLFFQSLLYKKGKNRWFLFSEINFLLIFITLSIIGLRVFYLYVVMTNIPNPYSFTYHLKEIILPSIFTVLPIIIVLRFGYGKYREKKIEDKKIIIKGQGQYESLRLNFNELIYIKSSDNYIEVFYKDGNQFRTSLIRNKISNILDSFPNLLRTHRSYIVNPAHIIQYILKDRKHILKLSFNQEIPVSKSYQEKFKNILKLTTK